MKYFIALCYVCVIFGVGFLCAGFDAASVWQGVLVFFGLTLIGSVIANAVVKRLAENKKTVADQKAREIEQSLAATCRDIAFAVIDRLVTDHTSALLANYRKNIYTDDYGRKIYDGWNRELSYFYDNIVKPAMVLEVRARNIDAIEFFIKYDSPLIRQIFFDYINGIVDARDFDATPNILNISGMSSGEYERYCASELKAAGWDARLVAGTGDQGVDIFAMREGKIAVFQCKLYSTPLGNAAVQEVHTGRAFYKANLAAVVSNADYTPGARVAAGQTGVILLHHSQLRQFGNKEVPDKRMGASM